MRHLYQAGWIRIGFSTGERGHKSPMVEFEGCEAVLRERDDVLWQLCERITRSPTMLPVRQRTDPVHLALPQASVADHHPEFFAEMMASFRQSKAFKGGIKECAVAFSARWTSTIDAPSPRDLPEKLASGMLEYNLSAHAPRWRGGHAYVSSSPQRKCPPEIVADAVQKHAVDIPTTDELAEILVRSGSPSSGADLILMLAEGSEQIRLPTRG